MQAAEVSTRLEAVTPYTNQRAVPTTRIPQPTTSTSANPRAHQ